MTDERLTDELARVLGWRKAPGRYLACGRSWIPESRFRPLVDLKDAFRILDVLTADYSLFATAGGCFTVEVRFAGRVGRASGEPKARTISLAVARALALDAVAEVGSQSPDRTDRMRGAKRGE